MIFRSWLARKFPPLWRPVATCGNPWLLWIHELLHSNLQEVAVELFTHFYNEILMVLEASGSCCESIIDGLECPRGCCEAICALLQWNIDGFGISRKVSWSHDWWFGFSRRLLWSHLHTFPNEILMFWNLWKVAGKFLGNRWGAIYACFQWNIYVFESPGCIREAAVTPFTNCYNEIFIVLEASGSCCESIDGLESPGGCCEAISMLLHRNIHGFGSIWRFLWIHYWWFEISKKLLWSHLQTFTIK